MRDGDAVHPLIARHLGGAESLRRKALSGGGWLLGRSLLLGVIDLIRTAVFARVLSAHDYGLMALVTMVYGWLNACTMLGLDVMIQRDGEAAVKRFPFYWTVKMARGLICCFATQVIAVPVAAYYRQTELVFLIRLAGAVFLVEGLGGFGKEKCRQELRFGPMVRMEVILSFVSLGLGIFTVFVMKNATALVINQLLIMGVQFVLSYGLYRWRPSLRWDARLARNLVMFSGSIIAVNVLNYFQLSFDRATIGKLFTLDVLGYYARGHFLSQIPVTYFSMIIAPVFMPAFQKIGDDPQRLRKALTKVILIYASFFTVLGAVLAIGAEQFVLLVYGKKWLSVVPVFRILLLFGVSKSIVSACPPIFFLRNRPWIDSLNSFIMASIFGVLCIPLTKRFGIEGTAWSIVAGALVAHLTTVIEAFVLTAEGKKRQ